MFDAFNCQKVNNQHAVEDLKNIYLISHRWSDSVHIWVAMYIHIKRNLFKRYMCRSSWVHRYLSNEALKKAIV